MPDSSKDSTDPSRKAKPNITLPSIEELSLSTKTRKKTSLHTIALRTLGITLLGIGVYLALFFIPGFAALAFSGFLAVGIAALAVTIAVAVIARKSKKQKEAEIKTANKNSIKTRVKEETAILKKAKNKEKLLEVLSDRVERLREAINKSSKGTEALCHLTDIDNAIQKLKNASTVTKENVDKLSEAVSCFVGAVARNSFVGNIECAAMRVIDAYSGTIQLQEATKEIEEARTKITTSHLSLLKNVSITLTRMSLKDFENIDFRSACERIRQFGEVSKLIKEIEDTINPIEKKLNEIVPVTSENRKLLEAKKREIEQLRSVLKGCKKDKVEAGLNLLITKVLPRVIEKTKGDAPSLNQQQQQQLELLKNALTPDQQQLLKNALPSERQQAQDLGRSHTLQ